MNCIDSSSFFRIDKRAARQALGLPLEAPIVLFGAQNPTDSYKGYESLVGFLHSVQRHELPYHALAFGKPPNGLFAGLTVPHTALGPLRDDISLRLAYSAADVFLAPSHQEAFGKTIAESLACGTPAVAYDIGGPNEIIEHGVSGYLCRPFDAEQLLEGVRWCMEHFHGGQNSTACETRAAEFSPARAAREYLGLYLRILSEKSNSSAASGSSAPVHSGRPQ